MIEITKNIDWKIGHFKEAFAIFNKNTIQSKEIPISDPQDNEKICDLSFSLERDFVGSIVVTFGSTPVSKPIFFKAAVILAKIHKKLEFDFIKFQTCDCIDARIRLVEKTAKDFKGKYLAENVTLNIQLEVTSK
jgi:hypothetical protein